MATNHGIYSKVPQELGQFLSAEQAMQFRFGICRIFNALRTGALVNKPDEVQRAAQLEHHFRTLCELFVFTLQELSCLMQVLVEHHRPNETPSKSIKAIHFKAECLADHVLTYLNTMVDDVAIVTSLATGFAPAKAEDAVDSMGKLRRKTFRNDPALALVRPLLAETDATGSWWDLGFAKATGARQLMVHNHHLVSFQASFTPGGQAEIRSVVMSPYAQNTFALPDFFDAIRNILVGLFNWLDRLEVVLESILQSKSTGWSPSSTVPFFLLPIGYPAGTTKYEKKYFPIPTCDGSDELPWSVTVQGNKLFVTRPNAF